MDWVYSIKPIDEFVAPEFHKMATFYPECFDSTLDFDSVKTLNNGAISVMSIRAGEEYIFMCLLHSVKNTIYISDVCVRKAWRGKGVLGSAFNYITEYYGKKGTYYLTLTASNEQNQGLNQKKRMKIFNKHDFYLSPLHIAVSGYGTGDSMPITVALSNGKQLNIKSGPLKKMGIRSKYLAADSDGNTYEVSMNEIDSCYTKSLFGTNQVHCPMKKSLKSKKGGRFTRKLV
jgi:hypothetical protein